MVVSCYHDITPASQNVVRLHDGLTRIGTFRFVKHPASFIAVFLIFLKSLGQIVVPLQDYYMINGFTMDRYKSIH